MKLFSNWLKSLQPLYIVGPRSGGDSTNATTAVREDKTGAQVLTQAHGKWHEASSRSLVFGASAQAGVAPGQTLSTTACLVLYNPVGSGKLLSILRRGVDYVSGTLGTGTLYDCINISTSQTAPSGGSLQTSYCLNVGSTATPAGVCRTGATVVAPTAAIGTVAVLAPMLASSVLYMVTNFADVNGAIILQPGTTYQIQAIAAAGTSPLVNPWVWWEESPIPS